MGVPGWVPVDIFSRDNEMRKDRASQIRTVPFGFFGKEFDESCLREVVPSSRLCKRITTQHLLSGFPALCRPELLWQCLHQSRIKYLQAVV